MSIPFDRALKQVGNKVKPGDIYLHPIFLDLRKNYDTKNIYPTELYFDEDKKLTIDARDDNLKKNIYKEMSKLELQSMNSIPEFIFNDFYILQLHNIRSIDDMNDHINNEIKKDSHFISINRILNIFIISKFDEFKENNNGLLNIYTNLNNHFWKVNYKEDELKSLIKIFLKNYFKKIYFDEFNIDCGSTLKNFLLNYKKSK